MNRSDTTHFTGARNALARFREKGRCPRLPSAAAQTRRRVACLGLLVALAGGCDSSSERTLYYGGDIITLDASNRIVEALGTEGDRIAALGSEVELRAWAGESASKVDLAGRALLPGFIDAHGHFPGAGMFELFADLNSPPIGTVTTLAELLERLREKGEQRASADWIVGSGYDDTLLREQRHPTRDDLDLVSTDRPVLIWHVSLHLAVANSAGLAALGIDAETPDPAGGVIQRRAGSREPNGVLEENAVDVARAHLQNPGIWDSISMLRAASRIYLENGVTTAQSGLSTQSMIGALRWTSRLGLLPLSLVAWIDAEAADAKLSGDFQPPGSGDPTFSVGAVKLLADGSIQAFTGYLREPYFRPPAGDPSYRGYPRIPRDELIERVARYHAAGLQIAVHGNGDASIDDILDAFEEAQRRAPRKDTRHVVIHAQMARDDQLDRMAALGVIPSFFSLHTYYWGDRHRDIFLGPERASRISPAKSAVERGMVFTIHADSPVVPIEPLRLVWSAVNRVSASGAAIGPAQRIGVERALRATTIDAAYQHFQEHDRGSLEPGKRADLVILSRSPFDEPETIDEIQVEETIVGGESRFRRSR